MRPSNPSPSSSPPDAAVDTVPLLTHSNSGNPLSRSRSFNLRSSQPMRTAARFFRRASGRRMMLGERSVVVRERAAEQLEDDWANSKFIVMLDVVWNLAFIAIGVIILGLSLEEKPFAPLRLWIVGYLLQCMFHSVCVIVELRRRNYSGSSVLEQNGGWENVGESNFSSGSRVEEFSTQQFWESVENSFTKHMDSASTMLSFIWWVVGFYWVTVATQTQNVTRESPQLFWLSVTFLAFDVVIVLICFAVACLVGIAICCCLPCILAILHLVADQVGATVEEIDMLPKYKFQIMNEFKNGGDLQEPSRGMMMKFDSGTPAEHVIALEDAECCICLSAYDDGAELKELPCNHHFHCTCIDKWLHVNATCPLCKFNILRTGNYPQDV